MKKADGRKWKGFFGGLTKRQDRPTAFRTKRREKPRAPGECAIRSLRSTNSISRSSANGCRRQTAGSPTPLRSVSRIGIRKTVMPRSISPAISSFGSRSKKENDDSVPASPRPARGLFLSAGPGRFSPARIFGIPPGKRAGRRKNEGFLLHFRHTWFIMYNG